MKEREDSVKEIEPLLRPKLPVPTATPLVGSTRNPYIDVGTTLVRNGWKNALIASLLSRQFLLNAFYFTYSVGLYVVDLYGDVWPPEKTNYYYRLFTTGHVISAQLFIWSWRDRWCHMHLYPEYLNALSSLLFLYAATLYRDDYSMVMQRGVKQFGEFNHDYYLIRYLEVCASGVEIVAAVGWVSLWFKLYKLEFGQEAAADFCGSEGAHTRILDSLDIMEGGPNTSSTSTGTSTSSPDGHFMDAIRAVDVPSSRPLIGDRDGGRLSSSTTTIVSHEPEQPRHTPLKAHLRPVGRGLTLQDPDLWANGTVVFAAVIYFLYQITVLFFDDDSDYDTNPMYLYGDFFFCANALAYMIAALRDGGTFQDVPEYEPLYIFGRRHVYK